MMGERKRTMLENLSSHALILGPRPGKKSFDRLAELNLTHCCTLLGEKEQPDNIKKICKRLGCEWLWMPINGGSLDNLQSVDIEAYVRQLNDALSGVSEPRVYLHCSAGIHRTGFFAYVLLRARGMEAEDAERALGDLRSVTANQVGDERIELAETMLGKTSLL